MNAADAARALPELLEAYDEPGQSLIQTHLISRFAREHVTVALSGLGGDELFSSYPDPCRGERAVATRLGAALRARARP